MKSNKKKMIAAGIISLLLILLLSGTGYWLTCRDRGRPIVSSSTGTAQGSTDSDCTSDDMNHEDTTSDSQISKAIDSDVTGNVVTDQPATTLTDPSGVAPGQVSNRSDISSQSSTPNSKKKTEKSTSRASSEANQGTSAPEGNPSSATADIKSKKDISDFPEGNPQTPKQSDSSSGTCSHNWQPVYQTRHHDAVTEQVWVEDRAAYDEPVYEYRDTAVQCNGCGQTFPDWSAFQLHSETEFDAGNSSHGSFSVVVEKVQIGIEHHDAVGHIENKQIEPSFDEKQCIGYRCSKCGEQKKGD